MRKSTLKFLSAGLLVGVIVGCGKAGPSGVEGLCEKLIDCGANTTVAECSNSLAQCANADAQADECLKNDDCGQVLTCYATIGLSCVPSGTATDTDTASSATDSATDTANPTDGSADTTANPTNEVTTTSPATSMTTDVETTTPTTVPGTDTTDPTVPETTTTPETDTTPETTGMGGGLYGPCDGMGMCPDGQDCLGVQDVDGNFCSPACDAMTPCPDSGVAAEAMCLLSMMGMDPTNCVLLCTADTDCPDGMTCKMVPMNTAKICSAP